MTTADDFPNDNNLSDDKSTELLISELSFKLKDLEDNLELLKFKKEQTYSLAPLLSLIISIALFLLLSYALILSFISSINISAYAQVLIIVVMLIMIFFIYVTYNKFLSYKKQLLNISIAVFKAEQALKRGHKIIKSDTALNY
ncbi:hypothetical protein [Spirosoma jeollabukense]